MKKAVFLDRDGTISYEVGYITNISRYKFFPYSKNAVELLKNSGVLVIAVTNQSAIARGYSSKKMVEDVNKLLVDKLSIDKVYYCPHHPLELCWCRKPNPGMIENAVADFNIDIKNSFMVGDKSCDMELAKNVGAIGVLVQTGYGKDEFIKVTPDFTAKNLLEAAKWIVSRK